MQHTNARSVGIFYEFPAKVVPLDNMTFRLAQQHGMESAAGAVAMSPATLRMEQMAATQKDLTMAATLQIEFAKLLGERLDHINYPQSPYRGQSLSETLSVAKTQAYKLLKGMAFPSLANLVTLRKMGLSMDEMLDALAGGTDELTELYIEGQMIQSQIRYSKLDGTVQVVVAPRSVGNGLELCVVQAGHNPPAGAKPVYSLIFPKRFALAVIEDNPEELELLNRGASTMFKTVAFSNAKNFLKHSIDKFDSDTTVFMLPPSVKLLSSGLVIVSVPVKACT